MARTRVSVACPPDDFHQFHHVRGAEEVHSQHAAGMGRGGGECVHVEVGGVRGQYCVLAGVGVEPGEDLFFDVQVLKGRFDDEVCRGQVGVVEASADASKLFVGPLGAAAAVGDRNVQSRPDLGQAAVQGFGGGFHHGDRNPRGGQGQRDAPAHGPGTDDPGTPHVAGGCFSRGGGEGPGRAAGPFGGEEVATGRRFVAGQPLQELLAFELCPGVESLLDACGEGVHCRPGREGVLGLAHCGGREAFDGSRNGCGFGDPPVQVTGSGGGRRPGSGLLVEPGSRPGDGGTGEIPTIENRVDEPVTFGSGCTDPCSGQDHGQCPFGPDESRQPPGAAGPRDEPQGDFRQPEQGLGVRDPGVGGHRQFQPPAQGHPGDGCGHRQGKRLDPVHEFGQRDPVGGATEFGDVGAGGECLLRAREHHGAHT